MIERRVERRTATRREWHALRRFRSAHARGVLLPDVLLWPPVMSADFARACRAYLKSPAYKALTKLAAASGVSRKIDVMEGRDPNDMETLAGDVRQEVELMQPAFGTFLPAIVVEPQLELAKVPEFELMKRFTELAVAIALRGRPGRTPNMVMRECADLSKIRDDTWLERTGPELRRLLRDNGLAAE